MADSTVVQNPSPLSEADFHAALMLDWSRMIRAMGLSRFALKARLSDRQVRNVQAGAVPGALSIFNLLCEDTGALDHVLAEYNLRAVPREAFCTSDPGTLPVAALLHHVAEAEHPDSHGGPEITPYEADRIPDGDLARAQRVIDHIRALKARKTPLKAIGA